MNDANTFPKDKAGVQKLMSYLFVDVDNIYKKYRSKAYAEVFFSDKDYSYLLKYFQSAVLLYQYSKQILNDVVEPFELYIPFDLRWKMPTNRKYSDLNIKDMILLCKDVLELSDDLKLVYDYFRDGYSKDNLLTGQVLKDVRDDLSHLKMITEYGYKTYGLDFSGVITDLPYDINLKIPINERVN